MKKFNFKINGNEYGVHIKGFDANIATIEVNGTQYEIEIEQKDKQTKTPTIIRKVISKQEDIQKKEKGSTTPVYAPLPGKILQIKVNQGDIVKKGDLLMLMEAMKMENNVLALKDGVVESIKVKMDDAVLEGDVLLEMV